MARRANLDLSDLDGEIWKDVVGFEGLYKVSNKARVISMNYGNTRTKRIMCLANAKNGYCHFCIFKNKVMYRVLLHRLVAIAHIPNPHNKPCVNHLKGVFAGHHVENLEWVTHSENEKHSFEVLGKVAYQPMKGKFGEEHNRSKKVWQCEMDGTPIKLFGSHLEAHRQTGVSVGNISSCTFGKRRQAGGYIWKNEI